MRSGVLLAICFCAQAQSPDLAYEPLARAYAALKTRNYDVAVAGFERAAMLAPHRAGIRKDLAYTYLKIGETERARDQFRDVLRLDPADPHVAKEYAFLCYETGKKAEARRIFDSIRKGGDAVAEEAFQNIDRPLRDGIERWKQAIAMGAGNFSAHFELATLAEQRDELELAAIHFEKAWRLLPGRRNVLVDLGRVWESLNRVEDAHAALLAAAHGGEPRAAEAAREMLPGRFPFVSEFRRAMELDSGNRELRRELAYLLLKMERQEEAELEFRAITNETPDDLLAATQLGFLLYARGDREGAMPLFERVLAGKDEDLANRVRAVLRVPQVLQSRPDPQSEAVDAKQMAERSIKAGYMKDALKYLRIAHESDPSDFQVMLKLGWTHNILKQDLDAARWFDLARRSPDPLVAGDAGAAWRNLRGATARFRVSGWMYPMYSSRWRDVFSYAQGKVEIRTGLPVRPYLSARFVGDTRRTTGGAAPQYLSESSVIAGAGIMTRPFYGMTGWFEAGSAMSYLKGGRLPDFRGGFSWLRGFGASLAGEKAGWFAEVAADGVFVSRFGDDFLVYSQNRVGATGQVGGMRTQVFWAFNATTDHKREYWANFGETGGGVRFTPPGMPPSSFLTVTVLRGAYLVNAGNPRRPNYTELRIGGWYAFSR